MSRAWVRGHSPSQAGGQITPGHVDCLGVEGLQECFCKYSQIYVCIYENHLNFNRMLSLPLFQENTRVLLVNHSHAVCHNTAYSPTLLVEGVLVCCWLAAGH